MSLGALEPKFWQNFCTAVDRDDLRGSQFGGPEIVAEVRGIFAGRTQAEWIESLKIHDCCCEPVLTLEEAADSDLVGARDLTTTGADGKRHLACPLRFSGSPLPQQRSAPGLGEHTRQVLTEIGLSEAELDSLAKEGVI